MDKYERFDKYFICSYYDEIGKKVGVFKVDTPKIVLVEAIKMFDIIKFE